MMRYRCTVLDSKVDAEGVVPVWSQSSVVSSTCSTPRLRILGKIHLHESEGLQITFLTENLAIHISMHICFPYQFVPFWRFSIVNGS